MPGDTVQAAQPAEPAGPYNPYTEGWLPGDPLPGDPVREDEPDTPPSTSAGRGPASRKIAEEPPPPPADTDAGLPDAPSWRHPYWFGKTSASAALPLDSIGEASSPPATPPVSSRVEGIREQPSQPTTPRGV